MISNKGNISEAAERIKYEIAILKTTGNTERVMSAKDIVQAAKEKYIQTIATANGKVLTADDLVVAGAANCSYILFRMGVTKVDPLEYELPFERFINPLDESATRGVEYPIFVRGKVKRNPTEDDLLRLAIENGIYAEEVLIYKDIAVSNGNTQPLYDILSPTHGHLIYQEQLLHLLHSIGGYSYAEADLLRKELSKRCRPVSLEKFAEGAAAQGYRSDDIVAFEDIIGKNAPTLCLKAHILALALG